MSIFGDVLGAVAFWRARRTKVTIRVEHELVDSDAPRVINLADIRPAAKIYRLRIVTTNRGERTEYMTSLTFDAMDGTVLDRVEPGTSAWSMQPREPLETDVPIERIEADLTGIEFRATVHLTSGTAHSAPTRLDDTLLAELAEHNRYAG